jgi:hypothetical protein
VTRLAATDDAAQRGELRAALVATGNAAVPAILDGMRKDPFPVELVLALSEISGAFHGFRREEWETWWRGAGGVR